MNARFLVRRISGMWDASPSRFGRMARGDAVPGGDLILEELRRTFRGSSSKAERFDHPSRLFFAPLEAFLVDEGEEPPAGRLSRAALDTIWQWICRDLLPDEAGAYAEEFARAVSDEKRRTQVVRAFQDLAGRRMQEALAAAVEDDRARRRLIAQVGTP